MLEEETEYVHRVYKVNEGDIISIIRQDVTKGDKQYTFYKVALKNKKDDTQTYYKLLNFPKGTDLRDGSRIKINKMVEYCRHLDRFNDTFYLFIEEFELLGDKVETAVDEYKEQLENNDMIW